MILKPKIVYREVMTFKVTPVLKAEIRSVAKKLNVKVPELLREIVESRMNHLRKAYLKII